MGELHRDQVDELLDTAINETAERTAVNATPRQRRPFPRPVDRRTAEAAPTWHIKPMRSHPRCAHRDDPSAGFFDEFRGY